MLRMPCRILVPWPGTETVSPSVDVWSPNALDGQGIPQFAYFNDLFSSSLIIFPYISFLLLIPSSEF